jgi:hypothetical protein
VQRQRRRCIGRAWGRGDWISNLRQSKVQHFHHALGCDLHVGRFQIPVGDSLFVRGFERLSNLPRNGQRLL